MFDAKRPGLVFSYKFITVLLCMSACENTRFAADEISTDTPVALAVADSREESAADLEELKALLKDQPERLRAFVYDEPTSQRTFNGKYPVDVVDNDGIRSRRVLMDRRFARRALLDALRGVGTPEGELSIAKQSAALSAQAGNTITGTSLLPAPSCSSEEGAGRLNDGARACSRRSGSLFDRIDFPLKSYLNCIKNQGNRGTCVAFALTGSIEQQMAVRYGRWLNLSEQYLYAFAIMRTRPGVHFGDGLVPRAVLASATDVSFRFLAENGWDYNPSSSRREIGVNYLYSCVGYAGAQCSDSNHQTHCVLGPGGCTYIPAILSGMTDVGMAVGVMLPANSAFYPAVKVYLDSKQPAVLLFLDKPSFHGVDSSGIISYSTEDKDYGSHAVELVGYLDNVRLPAGVPAGSGGGYFIVKNSWGCGWGDGGYGYMPYDYANTYGATIDFPVLIKY